ncbi:MAG: GNAT family N-acetyltransferase [Actinomycetota bacterium]|nr:GNAT family N-acetyltransferase [Actinomycetota bacterium]
MARTRVRTLRSLDEIDPVRWNALSPGNFRLSYDWLAYVEAGPFDAARVFVVAEEEGAYVGGFATYLIRPEHFQLVNPPLSVLGDGLDPLLWDYYDAAERERVAALRAELRATAAAAYPCAVCVSPFGYRVAIEAPAGRDDVLRALLEAFAEVAGEWGAGSSAFLFVPDRGYEPLEAALEADGYRKAAIAARCGLEIRWDAFDGYLRFLPSRRRYRVLRELRAFEQSGLTLEVVAGAALDDSLVSRLAYLSACTQARYGHEPAVQREEEALRGLLETLADTSRFFIVRKDGEAVSYTRGYHWADSYAIGSTGQAHDELDPKWYAHFQACYYAPIRYAISNRLTTVDFGIGAYTTKLRRGGELQPLTGFFHFREAMDQRVLELIGLIDRAQHRFLASAG